MKTTRDINSKFFLWTKLSENLFLARYLIYTSNPASLYLLKVNNGNTRAICEINSKLTIKTPERLHWRRSGVFNVNFEEISHIPAGIYLLKINNRITRTRCETCSKLTIMTPLASFWCLEHISHLVLVFLLLTLNT